ncbi:MAG: hypothetical protein ACP5QK_07535 [Myxococcota bacterium]
MKLVFRRNSKKRYKKPKIIMKMNKKSIIVAVSCQKIFGENEICNTQPGG